MALPAGRYGVTKRQLNKIKNLPVNTIRMIQEALKTSKEYTDDAIGWGSKNKLPPRTSSGIFTVNSDGSITIDTGGSSVEENTDFLLFTSNLPLDNGDWIVNFNSNSTAIKYRYMDAPSSDVVTKNVSEESTVTITTGKFYFLYLRVPSGTTVNNVTVYPMISKDGGAYEPYHASVDESKADNSAIGTVEDGEHPTRSYAAYEYMIRNGKFCTVTVDVTTSSTWTLGSNYVEGTIADMNKFLTAGLSSEVGTISNAVAYQAGNLVSYMFRFSPSDDIAAKTNIATGMKNPFAAYNCMAAALFTDPDYNTYRVVLAYTSGTAYFKALDAIPAGTNIRGSITYICQL